MVGLGGTHETNWSLLFKLQAIGARQIATTSKPAGDHTLGWFREIVQHSRRRIQQ